MPPPDPPAAPEPQGRYRSAVVAGPLVFSAGSTPRRDGRLVVRGLVGREVDAAGARDAAGVAAANAWAACARAAGGPDRLAGTVRLTVYVACVDGFTALSGVADGASDALAHLVGDDALPARTAVGVRSLPGGAPVEVDLIAALVGPHR